MLWSGQPKQGVRLQASDVFLIPFSLMWGGFAFFWEASVLGLTGFGKGMHQVGHTGGIPIFMALWGIPFCLVGLYVIFGRFFFDAISRSKTWYGVTERRLIIVKTLLNSKVSSFDHATLANLNLVERGDRSGDILFGTPFAMSSFANSSWPGGGRYAAPGFYLLPDARTVYNQIRAIQQQARK